MMLLIDIREVGGKMAGMAIVGEYSEAGMSGFFTFSFIWSFIVGVKVSAYFYSEVWS